MDYQGLLVIGMCIVGVGAAMRCPRIWCQGRVSKSPWFALLKTFFPDGIIGITGSMLGRKLCRREVIQ